MLTAEIGVLATLLLNVGKVHSSEWILECPDVSGADRTGLLKVNECAKTVLVTKGTEPSAPLTKTAEADEWEEVIENISYSSSFGGEGTKTIREFLNNDDDSFADSFLVYHKGKLIFEEYLFEEQTPSSRHYLFSATKSLNGFVAANLYAEGLLDLSKPVEYYLPDIGPAFSGDDVTVEMVLGMTNQYKYVEGATSNPRDVCNFPEFFQKNSYAPGDNFTIPEGCEFFGAYAFADSLYQVTDKWREFRAEEGVTPRAVWPGPTNKRELINMLKRGDESNGELYYYRTASVDVMAMIVNKVLQSEKNTSLPKTMTDYFGEMILSKVGMDHDFLITIDGEDDPNWGRGGSATARDMLRLGVMMLNGGKNHEGEQVIHEEAMNYIFDGNDRSRKQYVPMGGFFNALAHKHGIYNCNLNVTKFHEGDIAHACEKPAWSYNAYTRSFNPSGEQGSGEIAYMEGFYGQVVYVDKKADLVVGMMRPVNQNREMWYDAFFAMSKVFRDINKGGGKKKSKAGIKKKNFVRVNK